MPNDSHEPDHDPITTEEQLDSALATLLASAYENGIDPSGSWVVRNGHAPDWEVQVFELADRA
ncbi:MAG: hypothetical protein ABEJ77_07410 [Halanaeroarchaeum sp.]